MPVGLSARRELFYEVIKVLNHITVQQDPQLLRP